MSDRLQQILNTAVRVAPNGVGAWRMTSRTGPSTSVLIAPADLAWLLDRARIAERAIDHVAEADELRKQVRG
jgi:hypothetical protein